MYRRWDRAGAMWEERGYENMERRERGARDSERELEQLLSGGDVCAVRKAGGLPETA